MCQNAHTNKQLHNSMQNCANRLTLFARIFTAKKSIRKKSPIFKISSLEMGKYLQMAIASCAEIKKFISDDSNMELADDTWKEAVRSDPEFERQLKKLFEDEKKFEENLFTVLNDLLAEIDALEQEKKKHEDVIESYHDFKQHLARLQLTETQK